MIHLSERAAEKIRQFCATLPEAKGKHLRVFVEGGGCSGFSYKFKFDEKSGNDHVVEVGGATCLVDPVSLNFLKGSVVDYAESLSATGFTVTNPNAKGTCGCGSSFNV